MTDEQIKQYAIDSVEEVFSATQHIWKSILSNEGVKQLKDLLRYCIEKGAHLRDQEIEELKKETNQHNS